MIYLGRQLECFLALYISTIVSKSTFFYPRKKRLSTSNARSAMDPDSPYNLPQQPPQPPFATDRFHSPFSERGLSAHGPHMLPHPDHHHDRFSNSVMHCPRLPPLPANCFSLGVMLYTRLSKQRPICTLNVGFYLNSLAHLWEL